MIIRVRGAGKPAPLAQIDRRKPWPYARARLREPLGALGMTLSLQVTEQKQIAKCERLRNDAIGLLVDAGVEPTRTDLDSRLLLRQLAAQAKVVAMRKRFESFLLLYEIVLRRVRGLMAAEELMPPLRMRAMPMLVVVHRESAGMETVQQLRRVAFAA